MYRRALAEDWCSSQPHCRGNLGIPREEMPQIKEEVFPQFLAWLENLGIKVLSGKIQVGALKATQKEINSEKVENMRGKKIKGPPLVVSSDDYILDGHHRWAAALADDPQTEVSIVRIGLPIQNLLAVGSVFPGAQSRDLHDRKVGYGIETSQAVAWRYILGTW